MMESREENSGLKEDRVITTNGETSSLWDKMHRELSNLPRADDSHEVTIFRVPLSIRESNKNMFEPSAVSIGPYYRGLPHLRAMEENKWLSLRAFLNYKAGESNEINEVGEEPARGLLQDCINKIKEVEQRARRCYSEPFDMSSDEFVQMLVLDASFILASYICTDFDNAAKGWISSLITTDLILLENQIPFFIIETLWGSPLVDPEDMRWLVRRLTNGDIPIKALPERQKIHHLLHLCLCSAVPTVSTQDEDAASEPNHCPFLNWVRAVPVLKSLFSSKKEEETNKGMVWEIPCARELEEAGVKIKKLKQSDDITKITFQSGTLVIPRVFITDRVKPLFMNLIALEQCMYYQRRPHFSAYMGFLDKLVNTAHDVQILQKHGIIESMLSGEEEVAVFFNQCGVGVVIEEDHYLADLFKRVNKHCGSRYHRYRAKLSRDYFNNPWSIIALIAATFLLCLTILQSFMSVYSYIRSPSS
ncbi:hypothetical protein LUZ62_053089 [Rhynchospora pubera]|uniref:Uncharacterized protein n=1 Tax=Rhynchospora pubera TaxID=906938 RepID=A0AAV8GG40_9POAL|nr:hypothetical protein LUZ62_053089 [Rhynchospora pubera]